LRSLSITGIVRMGTDVRRNGVGRRQEPAAENCPLLQDDVLFIRRFHRVGTCTVTSPLKLCGYTL
jgi:hypothetical protein